MRPRNLRKLQLDGDAIGDKGAVAVFTALAENKTIESLEMAENSFGPLSMKAGIEMFKNNTVLQYLDLGHNRGLGSSGVILLSAGLKLNKTLSALCLNRCGIPPKGLAALAEALEVNEGLTYLNVDRNQCTVHVAVAFANMLKVNKTLQKLSLAGGSKKMGDKGLMALSEALEVNSTVTSLSVSKNLIHEQGVIRFALTVAKNTSLARIDLMGNKLSEKALENLLEGMKANKSMCHVFLDDFSTPIGRAIDKIAEQNRALKEDEEREFFSNVLKDGTAKGKLMRSKLMVIGQGMSGKTATVRSLLGEPFERKHKSTIGAALRESKISSKNGWGEVQGKAKRDFTKDFAAALAVEKLDEVKHNKKLDSIEESNIMIGTNLKGEMELTAVDEDEDELFTPKGFRKHADSDDDEDFKKVPLVDAEEVARKFKDDLIMKAREEKDALKFSIWDYGGQRVFYSLHHLFLTKYGIYMLVFDMRQMFSNPSLCKVYLQFWLNSLGLHAPETPLMLVGTYLDEINSNEDIGVVNDRIAQNLENFPFQVITNSEDKLLFFPISNREGLGISVVRDYLEQTARKQSYVTMRVPLKWLYTIEALMKENEAWITMTDFKLICNKNGVQDEDEGKAMLELFHELGLVLHLTQTSALKEVITLNPQWLIKSISRIIRDPNLHSHNLNMIKDNRLEDDVKKLFEEGLCSDAFARFVWNDTQVDYLLDLMRQTLLMCDWEFNKAENEKTYYFVPSLITGSKDLEYYDDDLEKREQSDIPKVVTNENLVSDVSHGRKEEVFSSKNLGNICVFEFRFLPDGVYDRLVCLCVAHSNLLKAKQAPKITNSSCEIAFSNEAVIKLYENKQLESIYLELNDDEYSKRQATSCLVIVEAMLKKLRSDIIGLGLKWTVFFPQENKTYMQYNDARKSKLSPWFDQISEEEFELQTNKNVAHIDVQSFLKRIQNL